MTQAASMTQLGSTTLAGPPSGTGGMGALRSSSSLSGPSTLTPPLDPFPVPCVHLTLSAGEAGTGEGVEVLLQSYANCYMVLVSQRNKLGSVIHVSQGGAAVDVRLGDRYNPLHHVLGRAIGTLLADKDVLLSCCLARNVLRFESGSEGASPPSTEQRGQAEEGEEEAALSALCRRILEGVRECKQRLDAITASSGSGTAGAPLPARS